MMQYSDILLKNNYRMDGNRCSWHEGVMDKEKYHVPVNEEWTNFSYSGSQ